MREKIYESHGIMTSAEKNSFTGVKEGAKSLSPTKKAGKLVSGGVNQHCISTKITFPAEALKNESEKH